LLYLDTNEIVVNAGISYTLSKSGRPAIFARDPDGNALEFTQV
jgi:glyoxylase I family protein